jgi:hypothetical protein
VISQNTNLAGHSPRIQWKWRFGGGWIFSADLAWIPFAWLNASDTHLLRSDLGGSTPEGGGSFNNVELQALISYQRIVPVPVGIGAAGAIG